MPIHTRLLMNNALAMKKCNAWGGIKLQGIIRPNSVNRAVEMIKHIIVEDLQGSKSLRLTL